MKKINEIDIERFIRFPLNLAMISSKKIKIHLEENIEARAIAEWYKEFYSEFDHISRPSLINLSINKAKTYSKGPLILAKRQRKTCFRSCYESNLFIKRRWNFGENS